MAFGSALLNAVAAFYNASDEDALSGRARDISARFVQLEAALGAGPYFSGEGFCIVDAVFGPVLRDFDGFDSIGDFGLFARLSLTRRVADRAGAARVDARRRWR